MTEVEADLVGLFEKATTRFGERIDGIGDQWSAATPCSEWDVRTLVNHLVYEQRWAPHLVAGETVDDVGSRYEGDLLGEDPVAAWRAAIASSLAAFRAADLDAVVHLSFADLPCREYLLQMLTDAEVHGWDLAKATGQDPSMDADVVPVVLASVEENEELIRGSGVFGDAVDVGGRASDADRLLGLLGRTP